MAQLGHAETQRETSWRRSSRCDFGQCVEVAILDGVVAVRDSKDPDGGQLHLSPGAWTDFLRRVRSGEFDAAS